MKDPLEIYVNNLLSARGQAVSEENRSNLLREVSSAISKALLESLPLAQLDQLEDIAQAGEVQPSVLERILADANVDTQGIIDNTLRNFQVNYLKGVR